MKKVLALVLAVVLAFGMATTAFAAGEKIDTIKGLYPPTLNGYGYIWHHTTPTGNADWLTNLELPPDGRSIDISLGVSDFNWVDGIEPAYLTASHISAAAIDVALKKTTGYPTIRQALIRTASDRRVQIGTLANGTKVYDAGVHIRISFITEMVTVAEQNFNYEVTLTKKGTKKDGTTFVVSGVMKNPETNVTDTNDTVYTADGTVCVADAHIRGLIFQVADDIQATMNVFSGGRYYFKASLAYTAADQDLLDKYPEIETIITMKTATNMSKSSFNTAKIKMSFNDKYYVYGADGKYLGLSSETLPFSQKYYLSLTKIDMGATPPPAEVPVTPAPPLNPPTGGDDVVVNLNNNPSTGVNGFVNVAIVAGLVALAAAGAVSLKK